MEHLKTYENWLKKAWNKMLEPKETKEYPADFNNDEEIKLKELLFKKKNVSELWSIKGQSGNTLTFVEKFNFESNSSDLKISITKYYTEDIPGHSISNFHVKFDNKLKIFDNFDKLIQFLKNIIPKIDLDANKFNL